MTVEESADGQLMGYGKCWRELHVQSLCSARDRSDGQDRGDRQRVAVCLPLLAHSPKLMFCLSGHVTAITVSPGYRRLGLAGSMMGLLERVSEQQEAWFVDLFVRVSNDMAIRMYEGLGYSVYRRVVDYYTGGVRDENEDAYGALPTRASPFEADALPRHAETNVAGPRQDQHTGEWATDSCEARGLLLLNLQMMRYMQYSSWSTTRGCRTVCLRPASRPFRRETGRG